VERLFTVKETELRKYCLTLCLAVICLPIITAHAQQFDVAFGVRTVTAPSASTTPVTFTPQSIGGGAYPTFSADYLFLHNFGIGGQVSWRASRNLYLGFQPYRPIFYDVDAVFAPPLGKHAAAELSAGIGAESVRFYQPYYTCGFTGCTDYTSSNHFMGHFGGGLRIYVKGGFFVRPEAHVYLVHNNVEFSGSRAASFGLSIGYTSRSEY
jgi:hypothetical protein